MFYELKLKKIKNRIFNNNQLELNHLKAKRVKNK